MITLLKQEFIKSWKQNRVYIWFVLALLVPVVILKISSEATTVASYAGGNSVAYIAAIIMAAIIFTQEFSFGTIRPLLSRRFSRGMVFFSKIVTYVVLYLVMMLLAFIGTMIGKLLFVNNIPAATMKLVWPAMVTYAIASVLGMLFVTALVLLVSNIVKSSGAAIGLGMVMMVGTNILSVFSSYLVSLWEPFKWNPLQLSQVISYYGQNGADTATMKMIVKQLFGTDVWVVFAAFILYLILIYLIAYLIFRRRNV